MGNRTKDIVLRVIYDHEEYELSTYAGEYRNLMELIYDKIFIEDFGECRGMGRCGTCLIEITECKNELPPMERNENSTIRKAGIADPGIRLACGLPVNQSINHIKIRIRQG